MLGRCGHGRWLWRRQLLRVNGGADEARVGVQDDGHGDGGDEMRHRLLVAERGEEAAVLECRQDLRRDATADVHTCCRDISQCKVAGFGTVGSDEDVQGLDAMRASAFDGSASTDLVRRSRAPTASNNR